MINHIVRVVILGPNYKNKGGIASFLKNLIKASQNQNNLVISFFPVRYKQNVFLEIIFLIPWLLYFFITIFIKRIHIVHAHPSENFGFFRYLPFLLASKLACKKIIFHIHGGRFDSFLNNQNKIVRKIIISSLNSSDKVICLSKYWFDIFKGFGIKNLAIIKNSIFVPAFNYYNTGASKLTFLGFIEKKKGIYDLVEAFRNILPMNRNLVLEVCGSGDDFELQKMIENEKLKNNIKLNGWIGDIEKERILKETAIFILPSYFEGLPMSILEAMAYGIPIISTTVGSIPELIKPGVNGFLVEPGRISELTEYISILLNDKQLCNKMSQENYLKMKNDFSIENTIQELKHLYKNI